MERICALAEQENIVFDYKYLPSPYLGLYIAGHGWPLVLLDKSLRNDRRLKKCIAAEELGHHFTSAGSSIYYAATTPFWKNLVGKIERKALIWSATHLMPYSDLLAAIANGIRKEHDVADEFDVTPELAQFRLINLKEMQLTAKKGGKLAKLEAAGQIRLF
jgi:hypothetical protein